MKLIRASAIAGGAISYDLYSYCYPTMLVAVRSVLDGGNGFLWNSFNSCGEPFFGSGTTGVLYPPAILFFVLSADHALYGLLFFNLVVATVSAYMLCRELQTGVAAAWCGALAFGLSNASSDVLTYALPVSGPYAWLPAAMLFCERILREPTVRRAVALAVTIALALIPGHPQLILYLYQLIALRVLWEFLTRRGAIPGRTLGMLALGLTLPPLLVAVQLIPDLEVMWAGVRSAGVPLKEISSGGSLTWAGLRSMMIWRWDVDNPFLLMPLVLASVAVANWGKRRLVVFYAAAAVASFDLALGPNGHLFNLYAKLPFGTLFKEPSRFLWVTSFCVAVLVALGVDAIVAPGRSGGGWSRRAGSVALLVAGSVGYDFLSPSGLRSVDWVPVGVAVAGAVAAALVPRLRGPAAAAIVAAIVIDLIVIRPVGFRHLLPNGDVLVSRAPLFTTLRQRMTAQDRVYLAVPQGDYSLEQKTGPLLGVPVLFDYETQPTRRWAAYFVKLRTGRVMTSLHDWGFVFDGWFPAGFKRRLLDLAAARYVVVTVGDDRTATLTDPPLRPVWSVGDVRVYDNPTALPRAFYVPRVEVVADPQALLERLATGGDDLRQVALVEEAPSGFVGDPPGPGEGQVEFVTNDPEHVVLRVHAPQRGFLFLADQYFPGWRATVGGAPAPIARANYAFRIVVVPAGESVVEFHYAPMSVRIGALVTGVTLLGVAALLVLSRRAAEN